MKRVIAILFACMNVVMLLSQEATGSMSVSLRSANTREYFDDSVHISLTGKLKRTLHLKPDSNGSILISKLPYGESKLRLDAKDCIPEKLAGIKIKDSQPVFLDFRMKSSIIQLDMEVVGYHRILIKEKPLVKLNHSKNPSSEEIKREIARAEADKKERRKQAVADSLFSIETAKQEAEHEHLKKGIWLPVDSLRNKNITDMLSWKELMHKALPYPEDAIDMGMEGKIYVGFETDEKGCITTIELLRGYDHELTVPVVHALNRAPGITPPKDESGKDVRRKYILAVKFRLE
jgi:hypothetical protein